MQKKIGVIIAALLGTLIYAEDAYAYIDPGTGSYILQALLAVLFGALFFAKSTWMKIKAVIREFFFSKSNDEQ